MRYNIYINIALKLYLKINNMKLNKLAANHVGLLQAVAMAVYCSLVTLFMQNMDGSTPQPELLGMMMILFLLVFSATVSGTLIFGYPLYLLIHHETKRALTVLGFTLLYALLLLIIAAFIIFL